jgi:predicted PolB exonuclease-like 3'-5' exonuclease
MGDFGTLDVGSHYRHVVVDIETAALRQASSFLDDPKPPKNYRDPEKIAVWMEEARAKKLAGSSLDPDLCRIVAIGMWAEGGEPRSMIAQDENKEAFILKAFWKVIGDGDCLVGFNIIGFDLPVLLRRSLYLLGPHWDIPDYRLRKYGGMSNVEDLMHQLSFNGMLAFKSLRFYVRRFGLDMAPDEVSGSMIPALVDEGKWDEVRGHVEADVKNTAALAKRLGVVSPRFPDLTM